MGLAEFLGSELRKGLNISLGTFEGKAQLSLKKNAEIAKNFPPKYNKLVKEFVAAGNKWLYGGHEKTEFEKIVKLRNAIDDMHEISFDVYEDVSKSKNQRLIDFYYSELDACKALLKMETAKSHKEYDVMIRKIIEEINEIKKANT